MSRPIRWSATVVVLLCLAAGAAQALPLAQIQPEAAAPAVASRLEAAWEWLASLVRPLEPKPSNQTPSADQRKDGCTGDPNGKPPCTG
jgi:hypothetical protein